MKPRTEASRRGRGDGNCVLERNQVLGIDYLDKITAEDNRLF